MIGRLPAWIKKTFLIAFLAGTIGWIFAYEYYPTVQVMDNRIIESNFSFIYEHWKEPKLRQLWLKENFKYLQANSQLDYFLQLCHWTHRQWNDSLPLPYPLCNAASILRDIRSGKTGGFCGQYGYVLGDVLKSCGFFNIRYVEAVQADGSGHFAVEVWSDEFRKWILLDPLNDLYFVLADSGVPANAYEVRESLLGRTSIKARTTEGAPLSPLEGGKFARSYRDFAVSLRSDLMRHPRPLDNQDRLDMFLAFRDRDNSDYFHEKMRYRNSTSDLEDIYYDCDKVHVEYKRRHRHIVLKFSNRGSTPNFLVFVYRTGLEQPWTPCDSKLRIDRSSGIQTLWVATKNQLGRVGTPNRVDLQWGPGFLKWI